MTADAINIVVYITYRSIMYVLMYVLMYWYVLYSYIDVSLHVFILQLLVEVETALAAIAVKLGSEEFFFGDLFVDLHIYAHYNNSCERWFTLLMFMIVLIMIMPINYSIFLQTERPRCHALWISRRDTKHASACQPHPTPGWKTREHSELRGPYIWSLICYVRAELKHCTMQ